MTPAEAALNVACTFCAAAVGSPCVFVEGPNAGKPRGTRYGPHAERLRAAGPWLAGWASRQPEVDGLADARDERQERLEALTDEHDETLDRLAERQGEVDRLDRALRNTEVTLDQRNSQLADSKAATVAAVKRFEDHMRDEHTPPPVVVEPTYPVPTDAVWLHPNGADTNPGTHASPRKTPLGGRYNALLPGLYAGFTTFTPNAKTTTLHAPDGDAILDGGSTVKFAITASGVTNLYGRIVVDHYAPTVKNNGSNAPIFYGGTSAGSVIDGLVVRNSAMAGLVTSRTITVRKLTVEDCGYCGVMVSGADDTLLEHLTIRRVNKGGHGQDGQLAALKLAYSRDTITRGLVIEDCPIGNAYWTDMDCRDSLLEDFSILGAITGTSTLSKGVHIEAQTGGIVRRGSVRGAVSGGLRVLDAGDLDIEDVDLRGNTIAAWLQRDDRVNTPGNDHIDGTPQANPWDTVNVRLRRVQMDGKNQLWAYAENPPTPIHGADMLDEVTDCHFGPRLSSAQFRTGPNEYPTAAALAARLGARWSGNTVA